MSIFNTGVLSSLDHSNRNCEYLGLATAAPRRTARRRSAAIMPGCSLQASGLTSIAGGQAPTFSYRRTGHSNDYFAVAMTYLTGTNTCYGSSPPFTPVMVNPAAGFTKPCTFEYVPQSAYTGIYCYAVSVTSIPDGVLTVSYTNYFGALASTPALFYATFGPSPAVTSTATAAPITSTVTSLATAPVQPVATTMIQIPYTTATQTNTIIITSSVTSTHTNLLNNCSARDASLASAASASSASAVSVSLAAAASRSAASASSASAAFASSASAASAASASSASAASRSAAAAASQSAAAAASQSAASASQASVISASLASAASASSAAAMSQSAASQSAAAAASASSQSMAAAASLASAASASQASAASAASQSAASQSIAAAASQSAASQGSGPSASRSAASLSTASQSATMAASQSSVATASRSTTVSSSAIYPSVSSTSVTCPDDNGKHVATSAGIFVITCGVDRAGSSLGGARYPGGGFQGCLDLCANTAGCADLSYAGGPCYLKSDKGIVSNSNPNVYAAYLLSGSSSVVPSGAATSASRSTSASPSTSTSSSTDVSCPGGNGQTFITSAGNFTIECYQDRFDHDIQVAASNPSNYAQCIQACAAFDGCQAVSYIPNGACYLKSGLGQANENKNVWGASLQSAIKPSLLSSTSSLATSSSTSAVSTSSAPAATSSIFCPSSDGQSYNTGNGLFIVECYTDRAGTDMSNSPVYVNTFESCINTCSLRSGCVDAVYSLPNGPCYLKSNVGTARMNGGVIGGRLISSSSPSSATAGSSSATTTSSAAAGVQTVTVTTTLSGTGYQCACTPTSGLAAHTTTPSLPASYETAVTCPNGNGTTYTSECGAIYEIECNADRFGNDLQNGLVYANTLNNCIKACDNNPSCVDISWVYGNGQNACYMKGGVAAIRENSNIWGARQISACTKSHQIKLHRKRVVRTEKLKKIEKRGLAVGPDVTYTSPHAVTITPTSVVTVVSTTTPAKSGTATTNASYVASAMATTTMTAVTTVVDQAYVTTCVALI